MTLGRRGAAVVFCALIAAPGVAARQDPKTASLRQSVERDLQAIAESLDGVMGYVALDLASGERIGRMEDAVFPTASTIKLALLYELFKQADEGRVRLDDPLALERRHVVGGSGILQELNAPAMPLRDYATLMIVLSDNTATNVVIDQVGLQNVTARMAALGLPHTKLRRRMIDLAAALRGDENVSTPAEIARLLQIIHKGDGLTKESHQGLLMILKKSKSSPIRRSVPTEVAVANKPGGLEGVAVDGGIVYVEGRPYVFTAMTTFLVSAASGDEAIEKASRTVFRYFDRLARSSDYGRRIR